MWLVWIGLFLLLAYSLLTWFLLRMVMQPRKFSLEQSYEKEVEDGKFRAEQWSTLVKEHQNVPLEGVELAVTYLPALQPSNRVCILAHGFSYTRYGSVKYALMFQRLGFHCYLYDHRFHGASSGAALSMGYYEQHDLKALIAWVRQQHPGAQIGLHGESLGASTALLSASLDSDVAFVIADCPYASLWDELSFQLKQQTGLPDFFLYGASIWCRLLYGFSIRDVDVRAAVAHCDVPTLYIHGKEDHFTPVEMSEALEKAHRGTSTLWLVEDSDHAESFMHDPLAYEQHVRDFILEQVH
ncbi:MAG: alpha/beta hydrolase [Erysipelotrichaceae bacterium]